MAWDVTACFSSALRSYPIILGFHILLKRFCNLIVDYLLTSGFVIIPLTNTFHLGSWVPIDHCNINFDPVRLC